MKILGKLFGSPAMVKLLRLFLFNPEHVFTNKEVTARAKITLDTARLELSIMKQMDFIKKKADYRTISSKRGKNKITKKKRISGWTLNEKFPYLEPLQNFLMSATPVKHKDIPKRLGVSGVIKLIVVSGMFIRNQDSRLDILVVGNNIRKPQLETAIKGIESELGKELRYAVFNIQEFKYRLSVYDRLIRDVFDYPHEIVLDKIGVESGLKN